jgi:hypothetical protein
MAMGTLEDMGRMVGSTLIVSIRLMISMRDPYIAQI